MQKYWSKTGTHNVCFQKTLSCRETMVVMTHCSRFQLLLQPRFFLFSQSRPLIRTKTVIRSVMGSSSSFSSKLLFRQLFEKESSTFTYLLADISHPDKPALVSIFLFKDLIFRDGFWVFSCLIVVFSFSGSMNVIALVSNSCQRLDFSRWVLSFFRVWSLFLFSGMLNVIRS